MYDAIVCYGSCAMANAHVHLREKKGRDKDLPHTASLQPTDKRVRLR